MSTWITTFLLWGLVAAGMRLAFEWGRGDFHPPREPYTTADIAEQGRMRQAETDVTYRHYNARVRR